MKTHARLALLALALLLVPACGGATFNCIRKSDGTVECTVDTHQTGDHAKPVQVAVPVETPVETPVKKVEK